MPPANTTVTPFEHPKLTTAARQVTRIFEQHGLTYEQSAYVVKLARRNLGLARAGTSKKLPEVISAAEAEKLISAAYRQGPVPGLIVKTLWFSMVRVRDLVDLEVPDIHAEDGYAKTRAGKGGKDRLVVLPRPVAQELASYIGHRRRGPVFVSRRRGSFSTRRVEQIVHQARKGTRMDRNVTPHTLRRSMATELLNRGLRAEAVSTLLGHASTETTRAAYARLSIQTLGAEVEQALSRSRGGES